MTKEAKEEKNSIFKIIAIIIGVFFLFGGLSYFIKPKIMVGPVDSEGNLIVPEGTSKRIVYSSAPIKEVNGSTRSNEDKCPSAILNDYELKYELGDLPKETEMLDEKTLEAYKSLYLTTAQSGKVFLILDMTITNSNSDSFFVNLLDMALKDKEGYVYQVSTETYGLYHQIVADELEKGEKISGKIIFEIPENENEFEFKFDDMTTSCSIDVTLD